MKRLKMVNLIICYILTMVFRINIIIVLRLKNVM